MIKSLATRPITLPSFIFSILRLTGSGEEVSPRGAIGGRRRLLFLSLPMENNTIVRTVALSGFASEVLMMLVVW